MFKNVAISVTADDGLQRIPAAGRNTEHEATPSDDSTCCSMNVQNRQNPAEILKRIEDPVSVVFCAEHFFYDGVNPSTPKVVSMHIARATTSSERRLFLVLCLLMP